ncbi:geranylgeranyl transferase type-2 subunit alpha-like [Uloborus diversus]|uniref:geranylgeranyl transferase type-2 subunit alpha-like n=1 Tax=Uloborus diversus TaxID=327109 RepID=UPI00240982DF|nr:geranylgeranyl transferase type-2 subunit alpha-like [Uloborus diversus]
MHGRIKVRTTEEQAEAKKREQLAKLKIYSEVTSKIFQKKEDKEYDEEGLELTRTVLEENPDFYTFWNYRRNILNDFLASGKSTEELKNLALVELGLTQNCLKTNPKSYGAWHHRYWVMKFNPEPDWKRELKLCGFFLSHDERNFHCWDYRRLVSKKCGVSPEEELAYTTELIESNFSNYSAWHYRSTLLPVVHPGTVKGSISEDVLLKELDMVQNAAFTDPDDQSVWFYHRWLLGRSKVPLQILNISVLKPQNIVAILLSEPFKINESCIELKINNIPVNATWTPVGFPSAPPTVWVCDLPDLSNDADSCEIAVELKKGDIRSCLSCSINGVKSFNWMKTSRADAFRSVLSAATKEVLEQELESCQQLNELESNCKWTLFTSILLMRALNDRKFDDKITEYMENIKEVDSSRKNYYNDLGSKFVIENTIETLPVDATEINLANRGLTSLHHFDQFILIEKIDLSSNCLISIFPLCHLICVKTIILDDNQLTDLEGLENLTQLKILSVKRNLINDADGLIMLKRCKNLQELFIQNNPVCDTLHSNEIKKLLNIAKIEIEDS